MVRPSALPHLLIQVRGQRGPLTLCSRNSALSYYFMIRPAFHRLIPELIWLGHISLALADFRPKMDVKLESKSKKP